ncbi:MAG: type transport system ATP-binding protein [Pseudonocardiales bacterium]|jgi:ABC-2 type transport system ATP-binding protein|nr:type transport system ATP-binding protein [Pseudonocardiales bacterium]
MCAPRAPGTIGYMIEVGELTKDCDETRNADQLLITGRGESVREAFAPEPAECLRCDVFVRSPRRGGLTKVLVGMGATVLAEPGGGLSVTGLDAWRIASAAAAHHIPIQELTPRSASPEDWT